MVLIYCIHSTSTCMSIYEVHFSEVEPFYVFVETCFLSVYSFQELWVPRDPVALGQCVAHKFWKPAIKRSGSGGIVYWFYAKVSLLNSVELLTFTNVYWNVLGAGISWVFHHSTAEHNSPLHHHYPPKKKNNETKNKETNKKTTLQTV